MIKETQMYESCVGTITKYSYEKSGEDAFFTVEKGDKAYLDFYTDECSALYALCDASNTEGRVESIPNPWLLDETENIVFYICMVFEAVKDLKKAIDVVLDYNVL